MGKSPGGDYQPPAENPAPSGQMTPTPGGGAPPWQSILPVGNGPAQLSDPFRSQPAGPPAPSAPPATAAGNTPAGAATSAAGGGVPAALRDQPPQVQQQYLAAKASGDDALAARILLAAQMGGRDTGAFEGRGNRNDWGGAQAGGRM